MKFSIVIPVYNESKNIPVLVRQIYKVLKNKIFELIIGISFLNSSPPSLIIFIALVLGISGMISVFKAVYLDKLKLNCACIGGYAKTPLGIISFIENLLMAIMSVLILIK